MSSVPCRTALCCFDSFGIEDALPSMRPMVAIRLSIRQDMCCEMTRTGHSAQNAALGCVVSEKLRERTDRFHLIFPQSTQIILTEPILVQESPQYILKSRTTRIVFVVDVF